MREIVRKYSNEIRELSKVAINENGEFINGYGSKIFDILNEYTQKLFKEVKDNTKGDVGQYTDSIIKLDILYHLLDDEGYTFANKFMSNITNNMWQTEAKIRLFMMFVKRINEIIFLLKGGHASAALAIARGIYEITVFFEIISKNDETLAERYLKHSNVDRLKIAKALGDRELEERIRKEIEELNFGAAYLQEYGWASPLMTGKINFRRLAETTEMFENYHLYTYCCSSVHASILNSKGGVSVKEEDKQRNVWMTTPSVEGLGTVVYVLMLIVHKLILGYFKEGNLNTTFINMVFLDIKNTNK